MKEIVLRLSAWLSLIGGVYFAIRTIQAGTNTGLEGVAFTLGAAYFVGGVATWALFDSVADIRERLPEPERKSSTYIPGWHPDDPRRPGANDQNPPGWNDPKP